MIDNGGTQSAPSPAERMKLSSIAKIGSSVCSVARICARLNLEGHIATAARAGKSEAYVYRAHDHVTLTTG